VIRLPLLQKLKIDLALLSLLGLAALLIFSNLGAFKDFVRAESYFALGSQLMVQEGDWLTPHAPDEPVLNKPPLQYWLTGLAYKLFGAGYATARLPSALAALALLAVVYFVGSRLYESQAGWLAVGILTTSYIFYTFARTAMSDMLLTLCVSSSLSCFILILTREAGGRRETLLALAGYLFVALGVLAKGPLAVLLVAAPLCCELLISRDFSALKRLRIIYGALIILLVAAPYFLLLYLRLGAEPLRVFFIGENLQRFTGEIYAYATVPFWKLPLAFVSDFAPWSLLLLPAIYSEWRMRPSEQETGRARRLVILWLFFPLVFFSFSHFKLDYYLLPSMPAAALVTAGFVARVGRSSRALRAFVYAFSILFALVMAGAALFSVRIASAFLLSTGTAWLLIAVSAATFLFILYSIYKGWPVSAIFALTFSIWFTLLFYEWKVAPTLARYQPVERLAAGIPQGTPRVYTSYAATDWANTLTFHLPPGTKVTRLASDKDGAELLRLLKNEPGAVVMLKGEEFERAAAVGIPLHTLAEGETTGHGGLTLKVMRRPVIERLRVVQGGAFSGEP
jgi:4-amino-4-deoxy-L-arabinose transferase-like glycosyltransferase